MISKLLRIISKSSLGLIPWVVFPSSDVLMPPQEFTNSVHRYCVSGKFNDFVEWIKFVDIAGMNRLFAQNNLVLAPETERGTAQLLEWKKEHISRFFEKCRDSPFIVTMEFFPYLPLTESTALSFDNLFPVVKACIVFSAKYGNPIAQNMLLFSSIEEDDEKVSAIVSAAADDVEQLNEVLQTPFVWNNAELMEFLKSDAIKEKVFNIARRSSNPFVLLNAYFIASELGEAACEGEFLDGAKRLGMVLAFTRLLPADEVASSDSAEEKPLKVARRGLEPEEYPQNVRAYYEVQKARALRYGAEIEMNRLQAQTHYMSAAGISPCDPSLHIEIADFYRDILEVGALTEVGKPREQIIKDIFLAYKNAHDYGDGYAVEAAIALIQKLSATDFLPGFSSDWDLPDNDLNEALTKLYIEEYKRQEDEKFIEFIVGLGTRTPEQVREIKSNIYCITCLKDSIMKWRL